MLDLKSRIKAFTILGSQLKGIANQEAEKTGFQTIYESQSASLAQLIADSHRFNGWFTENMVRHMVDAIADSLHNDSLKKWTGNYLPELEKSKEAKTIGVVMAGNIPLVGFHDFLTVLISGNRILARLSSDDNKLLPAIAELLFAIEPGFKEYVSFTGDRLQEFDAIIATGSNNTSRYFDYYFGKYPNIIRKNRNGIAFLTGTESAEQLRNLADDIFLYYGLGCRNVSKLLVPGDYNFEPLLDVLAERGSVIENHKYFNNYEYNKAIYLVNSIPHFDTGNILIVENSQIPSPVSVLFFEYYSSVSEAQSYIASKQSEIQCVVSSIPVFNDSVLPGHGQQPALWDYADDVDTMKFVLSLD